MDEPRRDAEEIYTHRELRLFGRDVSQIPCFRNSFLWGIGGGVAIGIATFLGTSRTRLSTHVGFCSFFTGTLTYWLVCRYQWSKKRFEYQQLTEAMRKQGLYEGTDVERQLLEDIRVSSLVALLVDVASVKHYESGKTKQSVVVDVIKNVTL